MKLKEILKEKASKTNGWDTGWRIGSYDFFESIVAILGEEYPKIVGERNADTVEALITAASEEFVRDPDIYRKAYNAHREGKLNEHVKKTKIYATLVENLKKNGYLLSLRTPPSEAKLYTARNKDSIGLVCSTIRERNALVDLLGGWSAKFSKEDADNLEKMSKNVFIANPEKLCLICRDELNKRGTPQNRTLYITAIVDNENTTWIPCHNETFFKDFLRLFSSSLKAALGAEKIKMSGIAIGIMEPKLVLEKQYSIPISFQGCYKQMAVQSFFAEEFPLLTGDPMPEQIGSLVNDYFHDCVTEEAKDGCGGSSPTKRKDDKINPKREDDKSNPKSGSSCLVM